MSWPAALLLSWLLVACGFTLAVTLRLPRRARPFPRAPLPPELVVVRPVDAPTALERTTLVALPGVRQLVVSPPGVHQADWGEHLPSSPGTSNRKVGHLALALASLPSTAVVVTADADVRLTVELLSALVTPVLEGAALCTAAPRPEALAGAGAWTFGGLLNHTHLSFRASGALAAGAPAVCGKAMALGPQARALLPTLGACAAEDLELSRRLHAQGARIALAEVDAPTPLGRQPLRAGLRRLTRWMVVLQAHRPLLSWTVPTLFCASLAAVPALALGSEQVRLAALTLLLARLTLALRLGLSLAGAVVWLPAEGALLAAWLAAKLGRRITWRGQSFHVRRGGTLVPLEQRW